ncbi:hypothetical protein GQR58_014117 [Nymphon striatum]|nr:hypothetical protein GQR58_014117 [Nymphon striatum]
MGGPVRRFKRICEHIQAQIIGKRPPSTLSSRRKGSSSIIGGDLSDSSSCGGSSERLFVPPPSSLLHHQPSGTVSADDTSEHSASLMTSSTGNGCATKGMRGSSAPPSTVPSPQSAECPHDNNANIPGPSLELSVVDTPTMKRRADASTTGSRVLANGRKPPSFSSSPKDKV